MGQGGSDIMTVYAFQHYNEEGDLDIMTSLYKCISAQWMEKWQTSWKSWYISALLWMGEGDIME